jgi:hypothetical protein
MTHPFAMKDAELENVTAVELTKAEIEQVAGGKKDPIYTTLAVGEEGGGEDLEI